MPEQERKFEGIWIPENIWFCEDLDIIEKCILVEIKSLSKDNNLCYASNEYFSKFFQCSERKISSSISKLISLGLVAQTGFDGRKRYLEVRVENFARLGSKNCEHNNITNNIDNKENIKRNENIVQPSFLANDENQVKNEKVDLETVTPTSTSSLTATNEQPSSRQKANKGTDTIVISALNDIYTKIEFMYKKCGYKDKLAKKDTITRLKTICNNTNKSKRLHPLQILLSYGAYLAECRKYGKDVQYVKQSNFFLTSMVYDYAEKTASDFEQRVVEKYGDGWKKYKVVD